MKRLAIIILNYKTYEETLRLCHDLQAQKGDFLIEILVVDNASPNDSLSRLREMENYYSNVRVISSGSNQGYACGNNYGLRALEQDPPDYIAIMNNDIYLDHADDIQILIAKYQELPLDRALVAPRQIDEHGHDLCFPRKIPSFWADLFADSLVFNKLFCCSVSNSTQLPAVEESEIIPGAFLFSEYRIFRDIGFFDESTFLFCEERFLAQKTRMAGLKNYLFNERYYRHLHSTTISSEASFIKQRQYMNMGKKIFYRKYHSLGRLKSWLLSVTFWEFRFEILILNLLRKRIQS